MGRFCEMCLRERPNEAFSARGTVCERFRQRLGTREVRRRLALEEIAGFLEQSHISRGNCSRLRELAESEWPEVRGAATTVLEVASVAPRRRRRMRTLACKAPELLRLVEGPENCGSWEPESWAEFGGSDVESAP